MTFNSLNDMSNFLVSARKYRPVNLKDVVGQETITTTLKNAITNNKLAQALLFTVTCLNCLDKCATLE